MVNAKGHDLRRALFSLKRMFQVTTDFQWIINCSSLWKIQIIWYSFWQPMHFSAQCHLLLLVTSICVSTLSVPDKSVGRTGRALRKRWEIGL